VPQVSPLRPGKARTSASREKTGSVFEESAIPLDKWLTAIWLVVNCKNGISSYEIVRDLKVTQKSAWFMLHRIRLALKDDRDHKLGFGGPVESDETFIGPNPTRMHRDRKAAYYSEKRQGKRGEMYVGKTAFTDCLTANSGRCVPRLFPT
jgi:hypothetical protein